MSQITFTVNNGNIQNIIDALKWYSPIPVIKNPAYVVGGQEPEYIPQFTDSQWAKEAIRRWVVGIVKRHKEVIAKNAVSIPSQNSIIS
jgi:hypothetical protein